LVTVARIRRQTGIGIVLIRFRWIIAVVVVAMRVTMPVRMMVMTQKREEVYVWAFGRTESLGGLLFVVPIGIMRVGDRKAWHH